MTRHDLLEIPLDAVTLIEAVQWVRSKAQEEGPPLLVHTVNVDHVVLAHKNSEFMRVSKSASLSVADGMPLVWASRLLGMALPERVTGVDLFEGVCNADDAKVPLFLFGGRPEVTNAAAALLNEQAAGVSVVGTLSPDPHQLSDREWNRRACAEINRSGARILAIALGAPKQELWFEEHASLLSVRVAIGIGGTLDFLTGTTQRAPVWAQRMGLEWLHRLIREPRRLAKRYLVDDPIFLAWVAGAMVRTFAARLKPE